MCRVTGVTRGASVARRANARVTRRQRVDGALDARAAATNRGSVAVRRVTRAAGGAGVSSGARAHVA